jgi:hypothetical protein
MMHASGILPQMYSIIQWACLSVVESSALFKNLSSLGDGSNISPGTTTILYSTLILVMIVNPLIMEKAENQI